MWIRGNLKERAKNVLRGNYWSAFAVSIVIAIVSGGGSGGNSSSNVRYVDTNPDAFLRYLPLILGGAFVVIALKIFAFYTLETGGRKFFVRAAEGNTNVGHLGDFFKESYMSVVGTMLLKDVFIFLWTLLLIIPGIIKSYAYRMVPYILADNPEIGAARAIELSNAMTKGEKFNIFVLELSFIGWYLLGLLALGIGILFVMPYDNATHAELYLHLRDEAIHNGLTDYKELNLTAPEVIMD